MEVKCKEGGTKLFGIFSIMIFPFVGTFLWLTRDGGGPGKYGM